MNNLEWLEKWYQKNCDGLWEHLYGIKIETLDNPGWYINIDLRETDYANLQINDLNQDNGDSDWIKCSITDGVFRGFGDTLKLNKIIQIFKGWVENIDSNRDNQL